MPSELIKRPALHVLFTRDYFAVLRATEFKQRCVGLNIHGVTLHSYRYSWAERAKKAGYPERYAQMALGHNSKAWTRAYSKKAQVLLPPLEEYERTRSEQNTVAFPAAKMTASTETLTAVST